MLVKRLPKRLAFYRKYGIIVLLVSLEILNLKFIIPKRAQAAALAQMTTRGRPPSGALNACNAPTKI